jgi:hypothetical protein
MKKIACLAILAALVTGYVISQEQGQEQSTPAPEQGQAQMQMPPPPTVKLFMGDLTMHGRLMTGIRAAQTNREGLEQDGNWSLQAINADWQENRAEIMFDYKMGNFGAFLDLQARNWGPNSYGSINPRYAFLYADFGVAKLSVGKLYDEILIMQNKVWKTEGFGDLFRFTDEDKFSARLEIKPPSIPGLNVGAQFFFVDTGYNPINSSLTDRSLGDTGAWKEIGLGAMYTSKLFNAQLGVRFDSNADAMDRDDSKTYFALSQYYGDASMLGTEGAPFYGPKYKHKDEVIGKAIIGLLPGKDGTGGAADYGVTGYEDTPFYDGGHYAFFGFKLNRLNKHLEADAHGGFYNLGAFDKFGYGRIAERFFYYNLLPKFNVGLIMQQEFHGGDVWDDNKTISPAPGYTMANPNYRVNSPFLQFAPWLAYDLAYLPYTNNTVPMVRVSLTPMIGICPDVLDIHVNNRVAVDVQMGIMSALLFYDIIYTDYKDSIEDALSLKPETKHVIGLALNFMF